MKTETLKDNPTGFPWESEKAFRNLIESVQSGIYMADERGNLLFVNQAFVHILGYDRKDEILGRNLTGELYANPQEREIFLKNMEKTGFVRDYEVRNLRKDGSIAILSATSNFIRDDRGEIVGVEGIVLDITEKKHLEETLKAEKSKLEQILLFDEKVNTFRKLDQVVDFTVEAITRILNARRCSLMLLDEEKKELCIKAAKGLEEEVIAQARIKLGEEIVGSVAKEGTPLLVKNIEYDRSPADIPIPRKNRASYQGRSFMSIPLRLENKLIGAINVSDKNPEGQAIFDELDLKIVSALARESAIVIENVRFFKQLEFFSVTDPLTGLGNYRYFIKSLDREMERARRFPHDLSLLMIDVDEFKMYNDTFGHLEGDHLLKELSKVFQNNLRLIDTVCRYGGDEFVVILPGTGIEQAHIAADKIKKSVEALALKQKMSLSIGISSYKNQWGRLDFISRADEALYQAKRSGKHRICVYR